MSSVDPASNESRRVLMLCYFFPPMAVSGSMRPASFCTYLGDLGYQPHVLSTTVENVHPPVDADPSLLELLPPGLRVDRLEYCDRRQLLLDWRNRLGVRRDARAGGSVRDAAPAAPSSAGSPAKAAGHVRRILRNWSDRLFMFPDQQKDWRGAVLRYVRALPVGERPDVVFATGSPWSALLTGVEVAEWLDVPLVADFRDPWAQNLKASLKEGFGAEAARLERRILERATRVTANTEALRRYFVSLDPAFDGKVVTLNNGVNRALLNMLESRRPDVERSAAVELNYFGTISRWRMPRALLEALERLQAAGAIDGQRLRVNFTGSWAGTDAALDERIARLEAAGIVARHEPVPYAECLRQMRASDHLLILQQGFPMQIPAKIFEYMAMQRPMVVIGGEGATADLVADKGLGVVCPDVVDDIASLLEDIVNGRRRVPAAGSEIVAEFVYQNLTRRLVGIFDDAVAEYAR